MAYEWFSKEGYLRLEPNQDEAENTFLFTLALWLIEKQIIDKPFDRSQVLHKYLNEIVNPLGRYDNHPIIREINGYDGEKNKLARTTHDQLTSYALASYLLGREDHVKIWKQIKSTWLTYDNNTTKTNFKRLVHPRDIIFLGILTSNYLCKVLLPIYYLFGVFTYIRPDIAKKKTNSRNGEVLYWLCSHAIEDSLLKRIFYRFATKRVNKRFGSWSGLFIKHCQNEEHPINALASTHTIVV